MQDYVYFKIPPAETNYVNRIMEGYEHVGVMTTVKQGEGLCVIRSTADTKALAIEILQSLPIPLEIMEDIEGLTE